MLQRRYRLSIRILSVVGFLLISFSVLNIITFQLRMTPPLSSSAKETTPVANSIGTISLSAPQVTAENIMRRGLYLFGLSSNRSDISFNPQNGKLIPGQANTVNVISSVYEAMSIWASSGSFEESYSVSVTKVSGVTIIVSLPTKIMQDQSFAIKVSIISTSPSSQSITTSRADQGQETVLSNILDAPGVPIQQAFGAGYDTLAQAQILAPAFTVDPQQEEQSLNQKEIDFSWVLNPNYSGPQTIAIPIIGIWVPRKGGETIKQVLAMPLFHLNVSGATPLIQSYFSLGHLDVSQLLLVLLSSALNAPWIIELVKKNRASRQKKATQASRIAASHDVRKKRRKKR